MTERLTYGDGVLTIRRQHPDDLERHLEAIDDAQIDWLWEPGDRQAWESLTPVERRELQRRHLEATHDDFGPGPKWCFSADTADARYVVYVDADLANRNVPAGAANISYACHPAYRGQGYASRAVRLVCRFLRDHTEAQEAHIVVDPRNTPSRRVALAVGAVERETFIDQHGRTMVRHVLPLR